MAMHRGLASLRSLELCLREMRCVKAAAPHQLCLRRPLTTDRVSNPDPTAATSQAVPAAVVANAVSTSHLTTSASNAPGVNTPLLSRRQPPSEPPIYATIHSFPSFEPLTYTQYPANLLNVPLRRDLLHRAVVYEADAARQGTASTKHRSDVHGSGRKLYRQKGTGRARVGDSKSPIRRGGGVAHGPHPRDFSTGLQRKVYDRAWRMALSYRFRRGELMILADQAELEMPEPRWLTRVLEGQGWGSSVRYGQGRVLFVTHLERPNLFDAMAGAGHEGRAMLVKNVDVRALLSMGKVLIEKSALQKIFAQHASDLDTDRPRATYDFD